MPAKQVSQFALAFKLLLAIALLYNITVFIGRLSTSLSMETLDFSTTAVSSTMAVGGLIAIPFIVWIGDLSDRLGRRRFLAFNFAAAVVGILLLGASTQLWHFWLVGALLSIANYASGPVTAALATDLLAQGALNKGLALINGMAWLAAIIGFAAAGILMDSIGPTRLYLIGAGLSLVALLCTGFLPGKRALSLQIPATAQSASGLRDNALHQ